ncbi:MAG: L-glutamate gamma-semialdehyde dehydrogenase [Bacteroidales bacterium]|nr:L-glutamate gamma-semialdehyde dehydrogenase [Candidatus Colimorpha merdihippi]MCQ2282029.1 L-glutamate gamma-semialdehyde dehydrogenase [Bacteroidales bacterium]
MNNTIFSFPKPQNEPVLGYKPGSAERKEIRKALEELYNQVTDIPAIIGGKEIRTAETGTVVMPTENHHVLAKYYKVGEKEVQMAIDAAMQAHDEWANTPWIDRASVMLKIATLITGKYRWLINAATMLGQGKTTMQAEIDSACELADFLRYNAFYASQIYSDQPCSDAGTLNYVTYRPLEGFVFAITPFNFTSIASNLCLSPVLMGNVCIWKPSTTSLLSNYLLMKIYKEAGVPDGVVNFLPGSGSVIGKVAFADRNLAGVHFTGSTRTFNSFWKSIGDNIQNYRTYPKIVGETGGKDFIFAHNSAAADQVATAIVRGAFEFQGQKCSAASRAYVPASLWPEVKEIVGKMMAEIKMGDVRDFSAFVNAVIDEASFDNNMRYIEYAKESPDAEIVFGGHGDKSQGWFIEPTVILAKTPQFKSMCEEIFGPVITVYVYDDDKYEETLHLCDQTSPYALTGAIFATDRKALRQGADILKYAAGNIYYNDKPTGAVVGQQPFGGARASGTNDKAGSYLNLIRWVSPQAIKETFDAAHDYKYPFISDAE